MNKSENSNGFSDLPRKNGDRDCVKSIFYEKKEPRKMLTVIMNFSKNTEQ
jgi:hypothetical protein